MKFQINHDYHIHSWISPCSQDPEQTPERILEYAVQNGFTEICLTDHHWDESVFADGLADCFYKEQTFAKISSVLPLPQTDKVKFRFGCEIDLDKNMTLGITKAHFDRFDFVIVPITHMHISGFTVAKKDYSSEERIAELWTCRMNSVLDMDIPFEKLGFAHLTCILMPGEANLDEAKILDLIPDEALYEIFGKAGRKKAGIELNLDDFTGQTHIDHALRFYRIAKECGCKFYLGSDAHTTDNLEGTCEIFEKAVNLLDLKDEDRFVIPESK